MTTMPRTAWCAARVDSTTVGRASTRKPASSSCWRVPSGKVRNDTRVTTRRVTVTTSATSNLDVAPSASASATSMSTSSMEINTPTYDPPTDFAPQIQVGPAFASVTILVAFAVVNRRVAAAVERRKDRETAEESLRLAKLRSLDGSADFDEVQSFGDALENARAKEAEAREILPIFFGADVRVRMPQPLGKPLSKVEEEEKRISEDIAKRRERRNSSSSSAESSGVGVEENNKRKQVDANGEPMPAAPPTWMTATVGFVLLILTWSATGLLFSPDPATGPALSQTQVETQMAMKGYDLSKYK